MSLPIPTTNPFITVPEVSDEEYFKEAGPAWEEDEDLLATGEWDDEPEDDGLET